MAMFFFLDQTIFVCIFAVPLQISNAKDLELIPIGDV